MWACVCTTPGPAAQLILSPLRSSAQTCALLGFGSTSSDDSPAPLVTPLARTLQAKRDPRVSRLSQISACVFCSLILLSPPPLLCNAPDMPRCVMLPFHHVGVFLRAGRCEHRRVLANLQHRLAARCRGLRLLSVRTRVRSHLFDETAVVQPRPTHGL